MTLKIIDNFIETVDPNKATVILFPQFIALFGSAISLEKHYGEMPKSKRDVFYWWLKENRPELSDLILLPESYNDWSDFAVYSDLLLFEKDLGYLTSAVLIFLESPGSIAELGAFSQIESLSKRLIVVVSDQHHPSRSFISLGPIRSIVDTQKHENSVCVIPEVKDQDLLIHIPIIISTLEKKIKRKIHTEKYNKNNIQHTILLVLDLINIFQVIQLTELILLLQHFKTKIPKSRMNQILFLLEKTKYIQKRYYGDNHYYVPHQYKDTFVDYTSNLTSLSFKRSNTKAQIWNEIQSDPFRKHVINSSK